MAPHPYVPLLSRIQLTGTAEHRPHDGRRHSGRMGRAATAVAAAAGTAYDDQRDGPATRKDRRSASPRRAPESQRKDEQAPRGRSRTAVPLAARLSSPSGTRKATWPEDGTANERRTLIDRLSSPSLARSLAPSPTTSPDRERPRPARSPPSPAPLDRVPAAAFHWDQPDRDVNELRVAPSWHRVVPDDDNVPRRTAVPIRAGPEVLWYLTYPFEEEDSIKALRLPHETEQGPAPTLYSPHLCPVPPGDFLLHPRWGPFRMASWKRNAPMVISDLMNQEAAGTEDASRSLAAWASAFRPIGDTRRAQAEEQGEWTDDLLFEVGLFPASMRECQDMVWENDMFLFRRDFEQLAARLHAGLRQASGDHRGTVWARVRDSIRRAWGPDATYFPDARAVAFLDSGDELVRLRHWRALARIMSQWDLPAHMMTRVQPATGGTVRDTEADAQSVLEELAQQEFSRGMHAFPRHRLSADSIM
ncbi:hypothetical protein FOMPIDRAFT_1025973 [Fomitopsis schrenkii]|uniref:Uncharacterized protein n=1 Tax=Fomitopsis schrenkii TaxID=2126942 RepID=S8F834_FOMSC|nr:hypothetical protein FOMPIDRAFT_1025973 [Fomitopsis schrenkii]